MDNVFSHKKKLNINSKNKNGSFYHNIDRNVNKYYPHLIGYNLPKLLNEFKITQEKIYIILLHYIKI